MFSLTDLLSTLRFAVAPSRPTTTRPDFRARLSLGSLEQLEERATPAAPLDPFTSFQERAAGVAMVPGQNAALIAESDEMAAMTPTQTFNNVRSALTITGNGGINVIRIRGNITAPITLSGGANDIFYVNVGGDMRLTRGEGLLLAGGVTADHVICNFHGNPGHLIANRAVINGTVLAPGYIVALNGTTINGELFSTPRLTVVRGGSILNPVPFDPSTPPAPSVANGTISGRVGINSESGFEPYGGMIVTLTGTDAQGDPVELTTETLMDGTYSFTNLAAGTYTLTFDGASAFGTAVAGTVDGNADGELSEDGWSISGIVLTTGDSAGVNYDFALPANS